MWNKAKDFIKSQKGINTVEVVIIRNNGGSRNNLRKQIEHLQRFDEINF